MPAASIFNAYVTASAVSAAVQLGLLDDVHERGTVAVDEFGDQLDLYGPAVRSVADVLVQDNILAVVEPNPFVVGAGPAFDDIWVNKGYFLWLVRGYGDMLSRVGELSANTGRDGVSHLRSGRAIAQAGKDYGARFVDPVISDMVAELDFSVMADLGCGSANRIIELAKRHPEKRFIGVEVDPGAVDVAREAVERAHMSARIEIVHDDVRRLRERPEYADVDALLCFFLGHDFWPRENCLATLDRLRRRMPRVRNFLLSDTYRSPGRFGDRAPIFTLGFELTHAVMGQHVPTVEDWVDLFESSTWNLRQRTELGIAFSEVFHLTPRTVDLRPVDV